MNLNFRNAVHVWEPKENCHDNKLITQMKALQRLFAYMQLGAKSYCDPQELAETLSLDNLVQQDAHVRIFNQTIPLSDEPNIQVFIGIYQTTIESFTRDI